jgi:hypothetical protein
MGKYFNSLKQKWHDFRSSMLFKNSLSFLIFIGIATVFWFVMAMNDSFQENLEVEVRIYNIPDSVTFINDPPQVVHVNVRDKGTNLMRSGAFRNATLDINFKEFASHGLFRFTNADLYASLRGMFGSSAQVTSLSVDSLRLVYTTNPGKRVPIVVVSDVEASSGNVVNYPLVPSQSNVMLYSDKDNLDTVTRVFTDKIVKRGLSETTDVEVRLKSIAGIKIVPSKIKVSVPVEPMVNKRFMANVKVINVPQGESLLLFPSSVGVSCFVPMSKFSDDNLPVEVIADYNEIKSGCSKLSLKAKSSGQSHVNVTLLTDSVEFTLVRNGL